MDARSGASRHDRPGPHRTVGGRRTMAPCGSDRRFPRVAGRLVLPAPADANGASPRRATLASPGASAPPPGRRNRDPSSVRRLGRRRDASILVGRDLDALRGSHSPRGHVLVRMAADLRHPGGGPAPVRVRAPVHAGLQALMGPRFGLPVLVGAAFGSLAIPLAWALGRRVRSPAFGLAFAMLVACSPIMLTWSRLSALCIASVSHVLLAMLVGWEAGRRGSVVLALAAGVVADERVPVRGPPSGSRSQSPRSWRGAQRVQRLRRGILLALVAAIAFRNGVTPTTRVRADGAPDHTGYAGNKGERTVSELIASERRSVVRELWHMVERASPTAVRAGRARSGCPAWQTAAFGSSRWRSSGSSVWSRRYGTPVTSGSGWPSGRSASRYRHSAR
jgi:hypothetical protein